MVGKQSSQPVDRTVLHGISEHHPHSIKNVFVQASVLNS
jgi:hypothetical protein